MNKRVITTSDNVVTLHLAKEAGKGYCTCTHPCPAKDVASERSFRRVRGADKVIVCTRVSPPSHINEFRSVFPESLQCKS